MTTESEGVKVTLSDSHPQIQTVSSFDWVSYQKSYVSLSGHKENVAFLKEGTSPSCLSNSNLRESSLNNTSKSFQLLLGASVLPGGTRKQALPRVGEEERSRSIHLFHGAACLHPTLTLPAPRDSLQRRDEEEVLTF